MSLNSQLISYQTQLISYQCLLSSTNSYHYITYVIFVLVTSAIVYGIVVFLYSLLRAPPYGSLKYYAHMVMTKREKYFKRYIRIMYVIITILLASYIVGMYVVWYLTAGEFVKPIYLSVPSIWINAEEIFERIEEAVMVYSLTNNPYFLQQLLLNPSQENIEKVMKYYNCIFRDGMKIIQRKESQGLYNCGVITDVQVASHG